MKLLVPNYSCLQNPWLGGYSSPDPRSLCPLSSIEFVEPPPTNKIPGYATAPSTHLNCFDALSVRKKRWWLKQFFCASSMILCCLFKLSLQQKLLKGGSSWNLMVHGDAREGKLANGVGSQKPLTLPRNLVYPALLPLMCTPRLPVVDWTDAPADLNGLVRFAERRNLVSARVPSHFKPSLLPLMCTPRLPVVDWTDGPEMDSSVSPKDEIWFLRMCHHISNAAYSTISCTTPVLTDVMHCSEGV